jgi:hypothetical protein
MPALKCLPPTFSFIILRTKGFSLADSFDFLVGQDTNGDGLYACTTHIPYLDGGKSTQLGKYRRDFDGCHVSWGGKEWDGALEGDAPEQALVD